jgi:putative ABC transport system substrate-binding protein
LVALSPDVVLASGGSIVGAFQQASRTVPIVFVNTIDPVGGGWVESLDRATKPCFFLPPAPERIRISG